jgi:diguanylate cyclase (GGDEF)-like protein
LSRNAEEESVLIAQHLSTMIFDKGIDLNEPEKYASYLEGSKRDFNLDKIKLFSANGEVVYSSDPNNIGDINKKSYFQDIVAKGNSYSKLAQKATESLEGHLMNVDVVETYVPIMNGDRFLGAFEIYLDITEQHGLTQKAVFDSAMISFIIMFGFFLVAGVLLMIASKKTSEIPKVKDYEGYHSPLNLLLTMVVSIFIAESVLMLILSFFPTLPLIQESMIDSTLLVMMISPALYYFLFHPLLLHINRRKESEDRLKEAYSELSDANFQLESEIDERKKAQEHIIQSQKEWEDTFNVMTDAITIHDNDFNIVKFNKSAEKMLDMPFLKDNKMKCYKFYHGKERPLEGCPSCDCMKTGIPASFELFEPHLNKHIEIRAMPRLDNKNNIIGTIHLVRDITERKKMEEKLKSVSITDDLTGLYNRRGFFAMMEQQLKIIKRENKKVFMLYVDIDKFKEINDILGHSKGDTALIDTAYILKSTYRESDIVARLGGDEFIIFPAGKEFSDVNKVTDRLQKNIDFYNTLEDRAYTISMSIGVAVYDPENPLSIDELLAEADRSMYENKKGKQKA